MISEVSLPSGTLAVKDSNSREPWKPCLIFPLSPKLSLSGNIHEATRISNIRRYSVNTWLFSPARSQLFPVPHVTRRVIKSTKVPQMLESSQQPSTDQPPQRLRLKRRWADVKSVMLCLRPSPHTEGEGSALIPGIVVLLVSHSGHWAV